MTILFLQRKSSKLGTFKLTEIYSTEHYSSTLMIYKEKAGKLVTFAISTVLMLQWHKKNSGASQVLDTAVPGGKICFKIRFNTYMQTVVNPA